MRLNMANPNPGVWFDYPDDPDKGRICLRLTDEDRREQIEEMTARKVRKTFRGGAYTDEEVNKKKRSELDWDYKIVDWENTKDENGVDIPCTTENKFFLIRNIPAFKFMVEGFLVELLSIDQEEAEEETKNSGNGSNGKSEHPSGSAPQAVSGAKKYTGKTD